LISSSCTTSDNFAGEDCLLLEKTWERILAGEFFLEDYKPLRECELLIAAIPNTCSTSDTTPAPCT
jgi:hypothetical protein